MSDGERPQHEEQEEGDDEVIFDRHAMKRRAFDDLRAKPNAPNPPREKKTMNQNMLKTRVMPGKWMVRFN